MLDAKQGLRRFVLHFLAWGGAASIGLYIAYKVGLAYSPARMWLGFGTAAALTLASELRSTLRGKQTWGKFAVDLTAKIKGLAAAFGTAGWWWT